MKKLLYILPAILLTSCFFSVGEFPPDFCDISQSYAQINGSEESIRCGDANIEYRFNNKTQLYELILQGTNMVPGDDGSTQNVGLTLTLSDTKLLTSGDYLNDYSKGWKYSVVWYEYNFSNIETEIVSLNISSDSTVSALVRFSTVLYKQDYSGDSSFDFVFRNLKLPSQLTETNR